MATTINPSNQTLTNHSLLVGAPLNLITNLSVASTGTLLQGVTSSDPTFTSSPTIGTTSTATLLTVASTSQTCLAIDNTVAHGTAPLIDLYHDVSTVANDFVYELDFNAQNSTPAKKTYVSEQTQVSVNTAASEMGTYLVNTINTGASQNNIKVGNTLGQYRGTQTNTTPPAGFIGETIRSAVAIGSALSLSNNVGKTITSISLTAGVWDVTGIVGFVTGATTITLNFQAGISPTNNTVAGNYGDDTVSFGTTPGQTHMEGCITIPSFRVLLSSTTTYYLVALTGFTVSTTTGYGRISATRVG